MKLGVACLAPALLPVLLLASCGQGMTPAEKAREDAHDIALIEAAQKRRPPLQPIRPRPLDARTLAHLGSAGAACGLRLRGSVSQMPVIAAGHDSAHMKLGDDLVTLAADTGGEATGHGLYRRYAGKAYWLETGTGNTDGSGAPEVGWVVIHDRYERTVFMAAGEWRCPPTPPDTQPDTMRD